MKCPFCDAIVPTGSAVCQFCGEPIPGVVSTQKSPVVTKMNSRELSGHSDLINSQRSDSSEDNDTHVAATEGAIISAAEPNDCADTAKNTQGDHQQIMETRPAGNETADITQEETNSSCTSSAGTVDKNIETNNATSEPAALPKATSTKPKFLIIAAILLFFCGVTVGGLFFRHGQPQDNKLPNTAQEVSGDNSSSNSEIPAVVEQISPDDTGDKTGEVISPENDKPGVLPDESNTANEINQPATGKEKDEFKEQITTSGGTASVVIAPQFQGVWGVYLANDDGSLALDNNGEMIFTGDFIVVDLANQYIFNIGEDGTLSKKWAIQKTEQSDMLTFWAENGYFSLAHLVTDSAVREICGTNESNTFNMVWFKLDSSVPSYEELLADESEAEEQTPSESQSAPASDASQSDVGSYAEFPGVPDFGALNNVDPHATFALEGGSRVYIYLHSDLKAAGSYTMSFNLYDQELLKNGFIQSGFSDNGSGSSTAINYGKYENGIATAVIINPLDNYGGEECMSVVVGCSVN